MEKNYVERPFLSTTIAKEIGIRHKSVLLSVRRHNLSCEPCGYYDAQGKHRPAFMFSYEEAKKLADTMLPMNREAILRMIDTGENLPATIIPDQEIPHGFTEATEFNVAFALIGKGLVKLMQSIWCWVMSHKAITALVLSLTANIFLTLGIMQARASSDHYNHQTLLMEQKVDSLTIITGRVCR